MDHSDYLTIEAGSLKEKSSCDEDSFCFSTSPEPATITCPDGTVVSRDEDFMLGDTFSQFALLKGALGDAAGSAEDRKKGNARLRDQGGVNEHAMKTMRDKALQRMSPDEARKVLGITEILDLEEVGILADKEKLQNMLGDTFSQFALLKGAAEDRKKRNARLRDPLEREFEEPEFEGGYRLRKAMMSGTGNDIEELLQFKEVDKYLLQAFNRFDTNGNGTLLYRQFYDEWSYMKRRGSDYEIYCDLRFSAVRSTRMSAVRFLRMRVEWLKSADVIFLLDKLVYETEGIFMINHDPAMEQLFDDLNDIFEAYDRDNNDTLQFSEYQAAWRFLNLPADANADKQAFDSVDIDRDGNVDLTEFLYSMMGEEGKNYGYFAELEILLRQLQKRNEAKVNKIQSRKTEAMMRNKQDRLSFNDLVQRMRGCSVPRDDLLDAGDFANQVRRHEPFPEDARVQWINGAMFGYYGNA